MPPRRLPCAYLLLNRKGKVKVVFYFTPDYINHKGDADSVVKRSARDKTVAEIFEFFLKVPCSQGTALEPARHFRRRCQYKVRKFRERRLSESLRRCTGESQLRLLCVFKDYFSADQHLRVDSADGGKAEKAAFFGIGYYDSDFVHMGGKHNLILSLPPALLADKKIAKGRFRTRQRV